MLRIEDLRCDYKRNPLGTDETAPRFSWKLNSDKRDVKQQAYELKVATNVELTDPIWDTGRVEGEESVHVRYMGEPLRSFTRYYYRVRVWDQDGIASAWSETAWWETAFLADSQWKAAWIGSPPPLAQEADPADHENHAECSENPCDYLCRTLRLAGPVASARVYATARGLYRLFLNGEPADQSLFAPGWTSYKKRLQYQTYDVTRLLTAGENNLTVMLANGWYSGHLTWEPGRKDIFGEKRALLLELRVTYESGETEVFGTDGAWQAGTGPLRMSEIYDGERYDATRALSGWQPAVVCNLPKEVLIAQENEPVKIVEELKPIEILTTPRGETVLDLGQNMTGWMRFTVHAERGTAITLHHAEVLDRDGNFYTGNLRSAKQTVTYICRGGGPETYEPYFSFQGFRYVRVKGIPPEAVHAGDFTGCVIHTALERTGEFRSSHELVNQLQHNIFWGQKGNFLDIPTDCPQRDERLGWTGDAQVFIRTAAYQMNVAPFFRKWLKDLAADQLPNGGVPYVIPQVLDENAHSSSAWGDAAVICPWVLYEMYGDKRILEEQFDSMKAWVEYIRAQGEQEYLWNTGFHFGDWLALDAKEGSYVGATPTDLIATAFFAHSADLVARAAEVLGKEEEGAVYRGLHQEILRHFRLEFVTPNGRLASSTQTAYVLALMFDLLEEKDRPRAAGILAGYIRQNGNKLTTGFVGTPYLCPVLSRYGYTDLAYELVLQEEYPSWLFSVRQGATTIWEHWDGVKPDGSFWSDDMNSFNHYAYGSVGEWLYRTAAGLDVDASRPGFKRTRIEPHFGTRLTSASASYQSLYGEHSVSWERKADGEVILKVTVPPNTDAVVLLPEASEGAVTESGTPLAEAAGIHSIEAVPQGVQMRIGSGSYSFAYRIS